MKTYLPAVSKWVSIIGLCSVLYYVTSMYSGENLRLLAEEHRVIGAFLFGLLMFSTTIIAPLTSLPLVPFVAPVLGPFTTGLACYLGWSLGAITAFSIGRYYGKPLVSKLIDNKKLEKYELLIRPDMSLGIVIVLHMLIPVDALSYSFGILSRVPFQIYAVGACIGIAWFSFAFAYMGDALLHERYVLFLSIGVASGIILYGTYRYVRFYSKKR